MSARGGEQRRLRDAIARTRSLVDSLEALIDDGVPLSASAASVLQAAGAIVDHGAKCDVYLRLNNP